MSVSCLVMKSPPGVTHLDGLRIETKALLLVGQEVLDILALISLELDDFTHLGVCDYGAIAGELLLDDLEDLLLVELLRQTLHGRQCLAAIALCVTLAFVSCYFGNDQAEPHSEGRRNFRGVESLQASAQLSRTRHEIAEGTTYAGYGCGYNPGTALRTSRRCLHRLPRTGRRS